VGGIRGVCPGTPDIYRIWLLADDMGYMEITDDARDKALGHR
jgi:hypothetical protein